MPHTLTASDPRADPGVGQAGFIPQTQTNFPFLSHAAAEDPFVWVSHGAEGEVVHAILHDEQLTRCADGPVGCWPGGRHAFSTDAGSTWNYSPFDAYNGTVQWRNDDGSITEEELYLRARPHLVIDEASGEITHLSNGARPTKPTDYVYTLVVPVGSAGGE